MIVEVERHKAFLACYLLLEMDGKMLLLRRFKTGFQDGKYTLVAGHIEKGETAKEAMKRETKEEVNIDIDLNDLKVVHVMHRLSPGREYVDFFLKVAKFRGQAKNMEKEKCDDMTWFEIDKLPKNILPYIPVAIRRIQRGETYGEFGFVDSEFQKY